MGKVYDAAIAVASRPQHYIKLGDNEVYLDPTTEAHESLRAMSSLIPNVRGWSVSKSYDVIYVGSGQFAGVSVAASQTKGQLSAWLASSLKKSEIARAHLFADSRLTLEPSVMQRIGKGAPTVQIPVRSCRSSWQSTRISSRPESPSRGLCRPGPRQSTCHHLSLRWLSQPLTKPATAVAIKFRTCP